MTDLHRPWQNAEWVVVDVEGNGKGTLTAPTEPGEYAIHCKYHPSMHGTLTVK